MPIVGAHRAIPSQWRYLSWAWIWAADRVNPSSQGMSFAPGMLCELEKPSLLATLSGLVMPYELEMSACPSMGTLCVRGMLFWQVAATVSYFEPWTFALAWRFLPVREPPRTNSPSERHPLLHDDFPFHHSVSLDALSRPESNGASFVTIFTGNWRTISKLLPASTETSVKETPDRKSVV